MSKPIVSVIVTCYNKAQYLPDALESLLAQTFNNWECIIVNDGSIDNTEDVALDYVARDKRFIYLSQENQGVVVARNNGVLKSQGEFILPLDGDDKIEKTFLEKSVEAIRKDSKIKIVCCRVDYFGEVQGEKVLRPFSLSNMLIGNCMVNTSLFRREDFDRVGGYNPNMNIGWEDWDFWLSILEDGGEVYKINEVLFYYRKLTKSRNNSFEEKKKEVRILLLSNHIELLDREYHDLFYKYNGIVESRLYKYFTRIRKIIHFFH
ncbi:MAG: glycosyltransferase family 2 protein [Prevotella sp.]|nr:glycosyltransferase family 2 protein [Prevotella sp.]